MSDLTTTSILSGSYIIRVSCILLTDETETCEGLSNISFNLTFYVAVSFFVTKYLTLEMSPSVFIKLTINF